MASLSLSLSLSPVEMAWLLCFFLFLISYTNACCVYEGKIKYFSKSSGLSAGACSYGSAATSYYGPHLAAAVPSIYKNGAGCGACFQIRCKNKRICNKQGTRVTVTDVNRDNSTDFVPGNRALRSMANKGMDKAILKLGVVDVEYKRVACQFKSHNFSIRVEEYSKKPNYLAVKFLYQGGKTEILVVDVAQVGSPAWTYLRRNHGAVWDTSNAPTGPLQFRLAVMGGFDAKWFYPKNSLPADWKVGVSYDTGVQINDNAMDGCSPCDDSKWK